MPDTAWLNATQAYRKSDRLRAQERFIGLIQNDNRHASHAAYYSTRCMQRG